MSAREQEKQPGVSFDGESLTVEDVRNLESNIIRRIASRFLTPQERAAVHAPGGSIVQGGGQYASSEWADAAHDKDPHDSDPHDKDVHDRLNFDRDNFNRA